MRNAYASIYVVSLDGAPLSESGHILVQASTIARPYGFEETPAKVKAGDRELEGFEIVDLGSFPWNPEANDFDLLLTNDRVSTAYVLDANGYAVRELELAREGGRLKLPFPADALYVVLR